MFDFEQSIADWRKQMLAAGIKSPVPLEELENHLRDEIDWQMKLGRSEAEAFMPAVQEIGPAHTVQNEFEKVEKTEEEREWKAGQNALVASLGVASLVFGGTVLFNSEMTFGQRLAGLAAVAMITVLAGVGRLSCRIFPAIRVRRNRTAVTAISASVLCVIWVGLFDRFILPGYEFPFGQYWAALLWSACPPCGAFFGLAWGIGAAARKEAARAGS
jgi:hypothetical protein